MENLLSFNFVDTQVSIKYAYSVYLGLPSILLIKSDPVPQTIITMPPFNYQRTFNSYKSLLDELINSDNPQSVYNNISSQITNEEFNSVLFLIFEGAIKITEINDNDPLYDAKLAVVNLINQYRNHRNTVINFKEKIDVDQFIEKLASQMVDDSNLNNEFQQIRSNIISTMTIDTSVVRPGEALTKDYPDNFIRTYLGIDDPKNQLPRYILPRSLAIFKNGNYITYPGFVPITDIEFTDEYYSADISFTNNLSPIEIFDLLKPSKNMVYIQYNDYLNNKMYKVYTGPEMQYSFINPNDIELSFPDHIYFYLWTSNAKKITKKSYRLLSWNLKTNNIFGLAPLQAGKSSIDLLEEKLRLVLPDNYVLNRQPAEIIGSFKVYGVTSEITSWNDVLTNDIYGALNIQTGFHLDNPDIDVPLFNFDNLFYISESNVSYASKSRFIYNFRDWLDPALNVKPKKSPLTFTMENSKLKANDILDVYIQNERKNLTLPATSDFINIKFTSIDKDHVYHFAAIFREYIRIYNLAANFIIGDYTNFIPEFNTTGSQFINPIIYETDDIVSGLANKISVLKTIFPELFSKGYSRSCNKDRQPIYIDSKNVDNFRASGGDVLKLPNGRWIGCSGINNRIGYILKDEYDINKDQYVYYPCCFSKPAKIYNNLNDINIELGLNLSIGSNLQLIDLNTGIEVGFDFRKAKKQYYPEDVRSMSLTVLKNKNTNRPLSFGVIAILPNELKNFLRINTYPNEVNYGRLGCSLKRTNYTIINCLNYVFNINYSMSDVVDGMLKLGVHILKQELYNYSDEDIVKELSNKDVFLDSMKYIRGLEEFYNTNIFVVDNSSKLEIPFCNFYSIKNYNPDRPCVFLYRNKGGKSLKPKYDQYELIIEESSKVMSRSTYEYLYKTFMSIQLLMEYNDRVSIAPYFGINIEKLIPGKILGQLLDQKGKLSGIIFNIENVIGAVMMVGQPINVPLWNNAIPRISFQIASKLFGRMSLKGISVKEGITGLWLGDNSEYFVPIIEEKIDLNLPIKYDPLLGTETSELSKFDNLIKIRDRYFELVTWVYLISKLEAQIFLDKYAVMSGDDKYDILILSEMILPVISNVNDAINWLSQNFPSMIVNNKIRYHSQKFYLALRYYLKRLDNYDKTSIPNKLESMRTKVQDFKTYYNSRKFVNYESFNNWWNEVTSKRVNIETGKIFYKLDPAYSSLKNPYIYLNKLNKRMYIVQNVILDKSVINVTYLLNGELTNKPMIFSHVLNICKIWKDKNINLGHTSKAMIFRKESGIPVIDIAYVIYGISTNGDLLALETNVGHSKDFFEILSYSETEMAALLPLN